MNETLFDEKIMGSFHFTPGNCVMGCDNGNVSQVHWDLVMISGRNTAAGKSSLTARSSARTASSFGRT